MTTPVPKLVAKPPGWSVRLLGRFIPGMRIVTAQIKPYTKWWDEQNQMAASATGPLLAVVGDSTAIGIGASAPDRGYVGLVQSRLEEHHGQAWRVINLGLSGARVQDALDRQLPVLEPLSPDVVICCIGTNDVVWGRETDRLRARLVDLAAGLPPGSIMATLAGMSARAQMANRTIKREAAERDLVAMNPWNEPGPGPAQRVAADRFHPNDLSYELMAQAFGRELGLPGGDELPDIDSTQP